jgi:hypothetical protein
MCVCVFVCVCACVCARVLVLARQTAGTVRPAAVSAVCAVREPPGPRGRPLMERRGQRAARQHGFICACLHFSGVRSYDGTRIGARRGPGCCAPVYARRARTCFQSAKVRAMMKRF